jgi:hypothetical protein
LAARWAAQRYRAWQLQVRIEKCWTSGQNEPPPKLNDTLLTHFRATRTKAFAIAADLPALLRSVIRRKKQWLNCRTQFRHGNMQFELPVIRFWTIEVARYRWK